MINWNFNQQNYDPNNDGSFETLAPGDYTVRIKNAEEQTSKNGLPMIKMTLEVSGHAGSLWYYMVFNPENVRATNQRLGLIFDSFGIPFGDMNIQHWLWHIGQATVTNEEYNGKMRERVKCFIPKAKQTRAQAMQPNTQANMPNFTSMRDDPSFNEFLNAITPSENGGGGNGEFGLF